MDYVQQWNFGIQHEVRSGLLLAASYIGTRGLQLFRATNINYPQLVGSSYVRPYDGLTTIVQSQSGADFRLPFRAVHRTAPLRSWSFGARRLHLR